MPEVTTPNIVDAINATQHAGALDAASRGFISYTAPPWGTNTALLVSQSEIAVKLFLPLARNVITGCAVNVSTGGSTLTGGQNLVTLYRGDGTLLGSTPDQSGIWTGTGNFFANFAGGPYVVSGGPNQYCWASLLSNGTTPATIRTVGQNQAFWAVGAGAALAGAAVLAGRIGAAVTAPASFNPANLVQTGALPYWIGLY